MLPAHYTRHFIHDQKSIEATLKHFAAIKEVEYAIGGKVITEWDA